MERRCRSPASASPRRSRGPGRPPTSATTRLPAAKPSRCAVRGMRSGICRPCCQASVYLRASKTASPPSSEAPWTAYAGATRSSSANQLRAFANQVLAQLGKKIDPSDGAVLLDAAQASHRCPQGWRCLPRRLLGGVRSSRTDRAWARDLDCRAPGHLEARTGGTALVDTPEAVAIGACSPLSER